MRSALVSSCRENSAYLSEASVVDFFSSNSTRNALPYDGNGAVQKIVAKNNARSVPYITDSAVTAGNYNVEEVWILTDLQFNNSRLINLGKGLYTLQSSFSNGQLMSEKINTVPQSYDACFLR